MPVVHEEERSDRSSRASGAAMAGFLKSWELILVDTAARTNPAERRARSFHTRPAAEDHRAPEEFRPDAAMQAGSTRPRPAVIATLDGDLQNDPADIPNMVAAIEERGLDLLVGCGKTDAMH
ncbi:glycosyltransferase [Sinorhizobium meliloti]|nr:glycosyltransferase [Sinorhizobium meliloti]